MLKKLRSPLYLALLLPALLAYVDFYVPIDHGFWNVRFKFESHRADNSIVVVNLDPANNRSPEKFVTSARLASVLRHIRGQMPYRVYIDAPFEFGEEKAGDQALLEQIDQLAPDVSFVVRKKSVAGSESTFGKDQFELPAEPLRAIAPTVYSSWQTNFLGYALSSPYFFSINGKQERSFSSSLSGVQSGLQAEFRPDYGLSPSSLKLLSEKRLLSGDYGAGLFTGKTIVISSNASAATLGFFGHGLVSPIAVDIAGASALHRPIALSFGTLPLLFVTWLFMFLGAGTRGRLRKVCLYGLAVACPTVLPVLLEPIGISLEIGAGALSLAIYGFARLWQRRVRRVQHTSSSGLPNLLALSAQPFGMGQDMIVAVIARYEEILTTLPKDLHGACARQIARRLSVGSGIETIYNGEGGHFGWIEEARPLEMQLNHLEGLRALFSAPLQIGPYTFDTNIHFGLDRNEGLDAQARVNSAVASANDALNSGRPIELFESERLAEASWELSLHARIDEGLRNGEIWLAYQSQWDMREGRPCGAEALIRWNHPTRGLIPPDAFILQAERAGRIDALTYWVFEEAITAALALNTPGNRFQMSVNLSAQMVDKPSLVSTLAEIVRRRGIDARLLTIEVTETSSVRNRPAAVQNLSQLRALGFRLSIDDFGTGEASLAYLADLPSDELKLDRRFVSRLLTHDRERHIIQSTIQLAHALGQHVVAEGIEDEATYRALAKLGCDAGQGYFMGRPLAFAEFRQSLVKTRSRQIGVV